VSPAAPTTIFVGAVGNTSRLYKNNL